jgi:hypothetical protein
MRYKGLRGSVREYNNEYLRPNESKTVLPVINMPTKTGFQSRRSVPKSVRSKNGSFEYDHRLILMIPIIQSLCFMILTTIGTFLRKRKTSSFI